MLTSATDVSSALHLNKISTHTVPSNNINKNNNFINGISSVENNTMTIERINHISSPLRAINVFFNKIKCQLSGQNITILPADIELSNILSQGKTLSHDADITYSLLNDKPVITPSASSLTTKTGVVLGGMLLSSAIVGGGFYYYQRAGREHHHDIILNTTHSGEPSSISQVSYHTNNPFNAHSPAHLHYKLSEETRDDIFVSRKKSNYMTKRKSTHFNNDIKKAKVSITLDEKTKKKTKKKNVCSLPGGKKISDSTDSPYIYSTKQSAVCLTDSFKSRCQKFHKKERKNEACLYLPPRLLLRVKGIVCLCPPPSWLNMKIMEPHHSLPGQKITWNKKPSIFIFRHSPKPLTTNHSTTFIPAKTLPPLAIPLPDNDETVKNSTFDSYSHILASGQKTEIQTHPTPIPNSDGEKGINLIECATERENITTVKAYRTVIETISNPFSKLLNEVQVIYHYTYKGQGCINNTAFYETSKMVESAVENVLSWLPGYDEARFVTKLFNAILEFYTDKLEGKEYNQDNFDELHSLLIEIVKDIISTFTTPDIVKLAKSTKKMNNIIGSFGYKGDDITLKIDYPKKTIKLQKKFNHLFSSDGEGFIFYDINKKWMIDNDKMLSKRVKEVFERSGDIWKDKNNIYFFKNSSPNFYGKAIIVRYHENIYALINNGFYKIEGVKLKDDAFRYFIKDSDKFIPIVSKGGKWVFEEMSSHLVSQGLHSFFINNPKVRDSLVSKIIEHQDVTPLTVGRDIQFDKNLNQYLKVNNEYFMIKKSQYNNYYIEGSHDILLLQMVNNEYQVRNSFFDGICCFHKEPLSTLTGVNQGDKFFLDNAVASYIKGIRFSPDSQDSMTAKDAMKLDFIRSPHIDGAVTNRGNDYFYYDDVFIRIHSNDDETYTLGDIHDNKNNIVIYKNTDSDTYYKISKNRSEWQGLIKRKRHCIAKRQPLSVCSINYSESPGVQHILNKNRREGIIIKNYEDTLVATGKYHAIYKKIGDESGLYYKWDDDIFFHVRENTDLQSALAPIAFIIYKKNSREQIDLNSEIVSISAMKDFNTKEIIFSTPEEAEIISLNIKGQKEKIKSEWEQTNIVRRKITSAEQQDIARKISLPNDYSGLENLFHHSGKKLITSRERADLSLQKILESFLTPPDFDAVKIHSLKTLLDNKSHPIIAGICNDAFDRVIKNINEAMSIIKELRGKLDYYVTHILKISDRRARNKFIDSLTIKLERMSMIFDAEDKGNIMIMMKEKPGEIEFTPQGKKH